MTSEEFRTDLMQAVKIDAAESGEGSTAAFVSNVADVLASADILEEYTPCFVEQPGKARRQCRVDGYHYDEGDGTLTLLVADYDGYDRRTYTRTTALKTQGKAVAFLDAILSGYLTRSMFDISDPAYELIDLVRSEWKSVRRIRVLLVTDADMSSRIKTIDQTELDGKPVTCDIWDIGRLYHVAASSLVREPINIDFTEYLGGGIGLPCLEAPSTSHYRSFLCIVPGKLLADLYDRYGGRLLESNVRSFLSTSRAVNKMIRGTIKSSPEQFFVYNNGIAATARSLELQQKEGTTYIVGATDMQIVNGGQTTASLSNARFRDKTDLSGIAVQMKLTMITDQDADNEAELVCRISRSSNSQTKVSEADFAALNPFHVRMEQISRRLLAPAVGGAQHGTRWFYERATGQYLQAQMRMTPSQKNAFMREHPKAQKFTKTDLAKARNAWKGKPHIVSKGAQANFADFNSEISKAWETNDQQFNDQYFQDSVGLRILFKQTEKLVSQQPWYSGGYRANIVAYTLALLHSEILRQYADNDLDLRILWKMQAVPEELLPVLAVVAKTAFDHITSSTRSVENVTQWCKRADCWARMKTTRVQNLEPVQSYLISRNEAKKVEKAAQEDQCIVSEMEAQVKILDYPTDMWPRLRTFAQKEKILRPRDSDALTYAARIPSALPSGRQSARLLALLGEARRRGFSV